ncbi:MAG: hypothetical protein FD156_782 [Nitrospirae bacterium]|nr:MAG: hypothetical protein FD156_782 [Nitrospirota bacterium]
MAFSLVNLDSATRELMLEEINGDIKTGKLHASKRLNVIGQQEYPQLLKEAAEKYDDSWLTSQLRSGNKFNPTEERNVKGKIITAKMNEKAPDMLAEGEFNRFYLRGLCLRAIRDNISSLIIYRAKPVSNPSPESEAKIGTAISPQALLNDLRANVGTDTAFGVPRGPNSGLSAKLP